MKIFYVYVHKRATDGQPFYYGKGKGRRAWTMAFRNLHHRNSVAKYGVVVEIVKSELTENEAFELEKQLIAASNTPLCNGTAGGDGFNVDEARKAGKKCVAVKREKGIPIFPIGACINGGKKGGAAGGKLIGPRMLAEKRGCFAPGAALKGAKMFHWHNPITNHGTRAYNCPGENYVRGIRAGTAIGKIGGKKVSAMFWWIDTVTGKRARSFTSPGENYIRGKVLKGK